MGEARVIVTVTHLLLEDEVTQSQSIYMCVYLFKHHLFEEKRAITL